MRKVYKLVLLTVMIAFSFPVFGQQGNLDSKISDEALAQLKQKPLPGFFGITFTNAVPQGEFMSNLFKTGLGFSVYGGYNAAPLPLAVGLEGDFLFFGGDTRYYDQRNDRGWIIGHDTVDTQSMIIPIVAFARIQPNTGFIFPFIEAFAGVNLFSTTANYKPYWGEEDSKDKFSASFTYGLGAGVSIKLVDFITLPNQRTTLNIDFKMKYAFGTNAEYSKVRILDDSTPEFKTYESETDMILTTIGVSFNF